VMSQHSEVLVRVPATWNGLFEADGLNAGSWRWQGSGPMKKNG